jgi:hypothetical protein
MPTTAVYQAKHQWGFGVAMAFFLIRHPCRVIERISFESRKPFDSAKYCYYIISFRYCWYNCFDGLHVGWCPSISLMACPTTK